jgi:hypothetical protein
MRVPDVRSAMQVARVVSAVAPPLRSSARVVAPLARKTQVFWWEFESEIKRRLALEILMRKLFAIAPSPA